MAGATVAGDRGDAPVSTATRLAHLAGGLVGVFVALFIAMSQDIEYMSHHQRGAVQVRFGRVGADGTGGDGAKLAAAASAAKGGNDDGVGAGRHAALAASDVAESGAGTNGCSSVSVDGRRFVLGHFFDEQMGSGFKAVTQFMAFAKFTNLTFVEPLMGGAPAPSQFHAGCPGPASAIAFTRLGALYDLDVLRRSGVSIIGLPEYWLLRKCNKIPPPVILTGSDEPDEGPCFTCEGESGRDIKFRHRHFGRLLAGNQAMCPGSQKQREWHAIGKADDGAISLEACCIRKNDGASSGHFIGGVPGFSGKVVYSLPRTLATKFIRKHGLETGFIGVQWRSEKDKKFAYGDLGAEFAKKTALIDAAINRSKLGDGVRLVVGCDFVEGGSMTMKNEKKNRILRQLYGRIMQHYDRPGAEAIALVNSELPEAAAAQSYMLVAATTVVVMARATEFVPLVAAGSFVAMVNSERKMRTLDPPNVPEPDIAHIH